MPRKRASVCVILIFSSVPRVLHDATLNLLLNLLLLYFRLRIGIAVSQLTSQIFFSVTIPAGASLGELGA